MGEVLSWERIKDAPGHVGEIVKSLKGLGLLLTRN
jgi:hypothetical protein